MSSIALNANQFSKSNFYMKLTRIYLRVSVLVYLELYLFSVDTSICSKWISGQ